MVLPMDSFVWDKDRKSRTGVAEAIFCVNKNLDDLCDIIQFNLNNKTAVLLTRLEPTQWLALPKELSAASRL